MPNFTAGTTFGANDTVTNTKLNNLIANAVINPECALSVTSGTVATLTSITKITSGTGTAAAPAISPTGDTNTGIFFPAADTIAFSEGGAEAMRINSSGNVGIGTDSPTIIASSSKVLDIVGTLSGAVRFERTSSTNPTYGYVGATNGAVELNAQSESSIVLSTNGTNRLRIDSSGNVGVNTTTSSAKLDVQTTGNAWAGRFLNSSASGTPAGVQIVVGQNSTNAVLDVAQGTDYTTTTSLLRVNGSGNVGIGNDNPAVKLEVNGPVRVGSGNDYQFNSTLFVNGESTGTSGYLRFFTNSVERARIEGVSGNVSIGTATALSKLHVHGDLTMSNATVSTTAATGGLTLPATAAGYLTVSINGTSRKIPYYA